MTIKIGDTVQTGVYVLNEYKPMWTGIVVGQTVDGTVSDVDVGTLHGCQPWIKKESTSHLRKVEK